MTILGISVGTTNTGVCVLRDDTLLDRHMHSYHVPPWSDNKMRIILNRYREHIIKNKVTAVIVKEPLLKLQNKHIELLLKRIEQLAKEHGCTFSTITKRDIRVALDMGRKDGIAEHAVLFYPELSRLYEKGSKNDHSYYMKLYEAVLSAHIYKEQLRVAALQRKHTAE
jgi:hypothetical protein